MERNQKKTVNFAKQHQHVLLDKDTYLVAIQKHKEHLVCLDTKMKEMKTKLWQRKKDMGGRISILSRTLHQKKHIRIMEDHVNQATATYDKLLSRNKELREEIEHLRRQRCTFAQMNLCLSQKLLSQHNVMDDLVEKSLLAYDQRSDALARMLAVRERSKRETGLCLTEMTELKRVIDHYMKLRSFMVKKSKERVPMGEDEDTKKRKAEQAEREQMGGQSLETYKALHQLIVEVGGDNNLGQIITLFMEDEDNSFAYFNYMNELNNSSNMLKCHINKLRSDIVDLELEKKQYDEQCQVQLKQLQGELEQRRSMANNLKSKYTVVLKFLDQQKTAVAHLFNKMRCNIAPITGKLGCSGMVTDDNVTQFIGILEEQVKLLWMVQAQCSYKESDEVAPPPWNLLQASCSLRSSVAPSAIEAPSADDSSTETLLGLGQYAEPV
ncbi:coiled-coil domain-containing protein 63 isoform X2 [Esox lucius]|uniref:coiled-coil domain-containing protein 63 isoform X2 n=1 Tax=Esox lucius TaxID=8010 RepID=UPI001476E2D4|nr:coiled-coil domain-containing protein 63 isoform X2 [Esox lucius]